MVNYLLINYTKPPEGYKASSVPLLNGRILACQQSGIDIVVLWEIVLFIIVLYLVFFYSINTLYNIFFHLSSIFWYARRDLNPQPTDYESAALTIELQAYKTYSPKENPTSFTASNRKDRQANLSKSKTACASSEDFRPTPFTS